nr:hypothetical protein [Roseibaca sp. Y0-43]
MLGVVESTWPATMARLLARAGVAERHRLRTGRAHPRYGNGTLMAVAEPQAPMPRAGDRRYLAAQAAVITAVLAWSEGLEGHGGQGAADAGDVEERF